MACSISHMMKQIERACFTAASEVEMHLMNTIRIALHQMYLPQTGKTLPSAPSALGILRFRSRATFWWRTRLFFAILRLRGSSKKHLRNHHDGGTSTKKITSQLENMAASYNILCGVGCTMVYPSPHKPTVQAFSNNSLPQKSKKPTPDLLTSGSC